MNIPARQCHKCESLTFSHSEYCQKCYTKGERNKKKKVILVVHEIKEVKDELEN